MAGLRQIEDFVENAFISTLTANADITTKAKHWKDASSSKTFPVVAVHCSTAINEPWTAGTISDWFQCFVEIGVISNQWNLQVEITDTVMTRFELHRKAFTEDAEIMSETIVETYSHAEKEDFPWGVIDWYNYHDYVER